MDGDQEDEDGDGSRKHVRTEKGYSLTIAGSYYVELRTGMG